MHANKNNTQDVLALCKCTEFEYTTFHNKEKTMNINT